MYEDHFRINRVPLLPRIDVWTKFEEGRSRHSRVIELKRFWHIWPWWPCPSDLIVNRVPLLPRTDVWTKFEERTLRRSSVIGRKQKGYRQTDRC